MEVNEIEIQHYNPKLKRKIEIIGILVSIIIAAISIVSLLFYGFYKEKITEGILTSGKILMFLSIFFLEFIPQMLSSHFPLVVSIISGINFSEAVIIAVFASLISTLLAFELGKKFGWKFVCSLFEPKKLIKITNFWNKYGKWVVFVSAFTPLPYFPLVFGALQMSRKKMWLFGIIPRIISFVLLGYLVYLGGF
ncbi:VTT domain-containing protein [Candidatus Pacearchaeota archaeon]|nr:VTT domain-containing protein [Candidatus Pacearchaeota archaeon]MBI2056708.1 VTT domain-containing protein [Candidatus Pacearchaeota archaeon]